MVAAGEESLEDMGATEERPGVEPRLGKGGDLRAERTGDFWPFSHVLQPSGQNACRFPEAVL